MELQIKWNVQHCVNHLTHSSLIQVEHLNWSLIVQNSGKPVKRSAVQ